MSDLRKLLLEIDEMPYGSARVEAARELWSRALQESDPRFRFQALCSVMTAASFGGAEDFFLSLFPYLIQLKREHPEAIDSHAYLWRLKWLANNLPDYPEIPLERIRHAEDHYETELRNAGGNPRTAIYVRWKNAHAMGQLEQASALRQEFLPMARDIHSDCHACEVDCLSGEAMARRDWREAIEVAGPILKGRLRCATVPHRTYAEIALASLFHGDPELAATCHEKGRALIRNNVKFLKEAGLSLAYLAAQGEADKALRVLKAHVPWLEQNRGPGSAFHFFIGAMEAVRLIAETRKRPLRLGLPQRWTEAWGEEVSPEQLARHFETEARQLATAYDRRNGNSWHTDYISQVSQNVRAHRGGLSSPS